MPPRSRLSRRTLAAPLLITVVLVASACGTTRKTTTPSSSGAGGAEEAASGIPSGTVLNLGDQQQFWQTVLNVSGALDGAPYKVKFAEFDSGPLVDAGFAAHRIDVGFMGDLPASLAASSGLPVRAFAIGLPVGASEYLVAKPGITSIAQLRGKRVAYTTGTAEQAFALRALASAGLTQSDVHQINVSLLQLGTVLETGAADASVVSVEQKVNYEQTHPDAVTLADISTTKPSSYLYFLATTSALSNPAKLAAIGDLTKRLIAAQNWEKSHQSEYIIDYYVNVEHQTAKVARQILAAGGSYDFVPLSSTVQSSLQDVVNLEAQAGAIPKAFSVSAIFDPAETQRYNQILAGASQHG